VDICILPLFLSRSYIRFMNNFTTIQTRYIYAIKDINQANKTSTKRTYQQSTAILLNPLFAFFQGAKSNATMSPFVSWTCDKAADQWIFTHFIDSSVVSFVCPTKIVKFGPIDLKNHVSKTIVRVMHHFCNIRYAERNATT